MPGGRKPKGGIVAGKPATAYGNRTDLNSPAPISAPTGQPYGAAGAQMAAQRAVPMAGAPQGGPPPGATPGGGPPGVPAHLPAPGTMPGLTDDSTNPNEHVMSGADSGPGPGPAAFGYGDQAQAARDSDWSAKYLPAFEFVANSRNGGDAARQIVRLLRSSTGLNN